MRRTCGYTLVDADGEQYPCGKPGTGWRWYQDVEHEDALEVACEWHSNEGGRRMAATNTAVIVAAGMGVDHDDYDGAWDVIYANRDRVERIWHVLDVYTEAADTSFGKAIRAALETP